MLVTVQTDYGDCCPYIVQYTRYTRLTLFVHNQAAWAFVVVFLGSTFIGVATALASALFFKRVKLSGDDAHLDHPEATHANQAGMSTKGNNAATSGSGNGTGSNTNTGTGKNVNSPLRPGAPATARSALNETSIVKTHKGVGLEVLMKGATLEASVVALFPWIAYMLAEALGLVGIVSILFCGIVRVSGFPKSDTRCLPIVRL
jgi:hypothetical protein|tara:strand:+ start:5270 stop:5878 length:609 start_codon:yes stop_codon:yes gene_type:complete